MEQALENARAQMRKGVLEYCILTVIANGDTYAPNIINRLKESGIIVVEGTLYPLLTRHKNAGLLSYRWEESPIGPPRKYYSLTDTGRQFVEAMSLSWNKLIDAVNTLTMKHV